MHTPVPPSDPYELLDFGGGRKLERFGPFVLDRPSPAAAGVARADRSQWGRATASYWREKGVRGRWRPEGALPDRWNVAMGRCVFRLQPSPFGHVGLFPEQAPCWQWIADRVERAARPLRVLNLFAYTGGSTLAAARAGAAVVHVDGARNIVARARENARASRLDDAPIRWICEDVLRFVRREVRRGHRYDGIVIDPPAYGHGPKRELWKLDKDLPELLLRCGELLSDRPELLLLTCHSPYSAAPAAMAKRKRRANGPPSAGTERTPSDRGASSFALERTVIDTMPHIDPRRVDAGHLAVATRDGRRLPCGLFVRWSRR